MIARIDKFASIKKLLHIKIIIKRKHTEWRKYFPKYSADRGWIYKIYKELKRNQTKELRIHLVK